MHENNSYCSWFCIVSELFARNWIEFDARLRTPNRFFLASHARPNEREIQKERKREKEMKTLVGDLGHEWKYLCLWAICVDNCFGIPRWCKMWECIFVVCKIEWRLARVRQYHTHKTAQLNKIIWAGCSRHFHAMTCVQSTILKGKYLIWSHVIMKTKSHEDQQ